MNRSRNAAALLALAAALATVPHAGAAQSREHDDDRWRLSLLAYPMYDALEGFSAIAVTSWNRPPRIGPEPITATFGITGRISTSGTRAVQVMYDAPALRKNWRLLGIASAERFQRAPYYGLGNEPADSGDVARRFYRYSLRRYTLFGAAQYDLLTHVRLHGGVQLRQYRARPLDGDTTLLVRDFAAGAVADTGSSTVAELRLGVVYDTRDEESTPTRGVFVEALLGRGLTDRGYTRYLLGAREFIPLGEWNVLALRQSLELAGGMMPFYVMYERFTSWRPEDGFGGVTTLRSHLPGRFLAPNRAILSVDFRHKKIEVPIPTSPFRLWLIAFGDVGRLWMNGESPDLNGLHWDVGGGAFGQFSKATMFGIMIGMSRIDGFEFGSAVSFGF